MGLDFHHKANSSAGNFSRDRARTEVERHFGRLGLNSRAKEHFIRELDRAGKVTGKEFSEIVDIAHRKGIIDSYKAERIKDDVELPDTLNSHWG